ncbi:TolC family protein [Vogesella indigofera]|uniref:TolC family protein n=1 Tax=Vogesella indigofera TaxID=45465 RepID=A0ABT5I1A3_VOGIN|nr:TolC family protein [Vogesella indigofera]MDC7689802.1 TolC family protein [Vogesella indigofera]
MSSTIDTRRGWASACVFRGLLCGLLLPLGSALAMDGVVPAMRATAAANPQVASKQAELRSLGFRVDEAKAARLPSLSVEARTLDESTSRGLLRLQQPLWAFGRIDGAIDLAAEKEKVGQLELLDLRRRLIEEAASVYANLNGTRRRLAVAEGSIAELDSLYQMIHRRQTGGVAADADVRLAASRLTQARLTRQQLLSQIEKLQYDLAALSRQPIQGIQPVAEDLLELPSPARLIDMLDIRHSGLLVRQGRLEVIRAEVSLRKSELMPTVSARADRDIAPRSTATTVHLRYGIVFEGRLEGGGLVGMRRIEAETARIQGAQEDVEAMRVESRQRLDRLISERNLQRDMLASQEGVVDSVRATLASFVRQYDAGRKGWVDVLNTQRELSDAQQQLESARAAWVDASLRIAVMLGLLDETVGVAP